MWLSRTLNNRISRLHERFLIACNEKHSSFRCFFERDRSVYIQIGNSRILAKEILKDSEGITRNKFGNILISMPPENFSSHYQSGFHLNPGKFGIEWNRNDCSLRS